MYKVVLSTFVGLALISNAAFSSTVKLSKSKDLVAFKTGPYLGIQAGKGSMDMVGMDRYADAQQDYNYWDKLNWRSSKRIYGGFLWNRNAWSYGVEMGYADYPDNEYKVTDPSNDFITWRFEGHMFDVLGVLHYNFNRFNIIGKLGVARAFQKTKVRYNITRIEGDKLRSNFLPELALGFGFNFNQYIGVSLSYIHLFGENPKKIHGDYYYDWGEYYKASFNEITEVASVDLLLFGIECHL